VEPDTAYPKIETARLVLRSMSMEDADFLFQEWSDPAVTLLMCDEEPLKSKEQAIEFLGSLQAPEKLPGLKWWGIEHKAAGHLIGTCGYFRWDQQHHRAEIGYDLCPDVWGQGLMPEALRMLIRYGFEEMNLNRIEAMTHIENRRSQKVLLKLGFQKEGMLRAYFCREGIYHDQVQYSLLKREWLYQ
jgi:ribosomal-protein-alanine N-acetyltransferase